MVEELRWYGTGLYVPYEQYSNLLDDINVQDALHVLRTQVHDDDGFFQPGTPFRDNVCIQYIYHPNYGQCMLFSPFIWIYKNKYALLGALDISTAVSKGCFHERTQRKARVSLKQHHALGPVLGKRLLELPDAVYDVADFPVNPGDFTEKQMDLLHYQASASKK